MTVSMATWLSEPGQFPGFEEPKQVKIGSIFYTSWGYDQTNVDYYEVISLSPSGKTAKLRKLKSSCVDDPHGPVTHVAAVQSDNEDRFFDEGYGWCQNCRTRTREVGKFNPDKGYVTKALVHYNTDEAYCIDENGYKIEGQVAELAPPKIYTKRINTSCGDPILSWNSYSNAYLWDGVPKYQTGFGWGH